MGIGNWGSNQSASSGTAPRAHYPSWGSGTYDRATHSVLMGVSLPLMGIGNRVMEGLRPVPLRAHYPSWGSGTASSRARPRIPRASHYPSWGSGTSVLKLPSTLGNGSHYPSWGSGTSSTSRLRAPTCPHYPSWGSGTRARRQGDAAPQASLPLMGIGNLVGARSRRIEADSSLPLMGIGNRAPDLGPNTHLDHLTTPHGDRERGHHLRGPPGFGYAHYPSWGSGTGRCPGRRTDG